MDYIPNIGINNNYRFLHEKFISNNNGTTFAESVTILMSPTLLIVPSQMIVYTLLNPSNPRKSPAFNYFLIYLVEFVCIALPMITFSTILSNYFAFYFILMTLLLFIMLSFTSVIDDENIERPIAMPKRPTITYFRCIVNVGSAIAILGVDFKIFPRRFAKTETFGFGVMDAGVGLFIIANALTTPVNIMDTNSINMNNFYKSVKHTVPLIILGTARVIVLESLNYQQHITEYGVHLNFFFILSIIKFIVPLTLPFMKPSSLYFYTISLTVMQQMILMYRAQDWVLSNVLRNNFLDANREGIVSILGYLSLYLGGVAIGLQFPNKRGAKVRDNMELVLKLGAASVVLGLLTGYTYSAFGISRRLTNSCYILFILLVSVLILILCLLSEALMINFTKKPSNIPEIFKAINQYPLLFFILANLLTGIVNLSVNAIYIGPVTSFLILICYMFTLCSITIGFYVRTRKD